MFFFMHSLASNSPALNLQISILLCSSSHILLLNSKEKKASSKRQLVNTFFYFNDVLFDEITIILQRTE